ncbi:alpha/beta hydrolase-fold protein [Limibacter armeniacum]|uniref:alpha/beta hydrolase n=1 Tax=Limibacter armeniacum TaxID=466084 RepID=UPI002FE5B89A
MKTVVAAILILMFCIRGGEPIPEVSSGEIRRLSSFPSAFISSRNVDIWLPAGYTADKEYDVLYMHDGQMLFDDNITWNKQEWGVDEVASALMRDGEVRDFIVVGIWNGGSEYRTIEYFPQTPFESIEKVKQDSILSVFRSNEQFKLADKPMSDRYLKFLVKELKPHVDSTFSTNQGRENTFVAGSSYGGLISLYAICEYPEVFGGAACISTHWPGTFDTKNNPIPDVFLSYMREHLPDPATHKIYFDYGTATLDSLYPPIQQKADQIMKEKGFKKGKNWVTKKYEGAAHTETDWNARLAVPVTFLFGK